MSTRPSNPAETRAIVTTPSGVSPSGVSPSGVSPSGVTPTRPAPSLPAVPAPKPLARTSAVNKQLSDLPREELEHLAEEYGLDAHDFKTPQHLISALHDRRQLIASMERDAMLDVIRWGRRPLPLNATSELIAQQIAKIRSMRFSGLSHRGLVILAQMRGLHATIEDPIPNIIRRLKKQEGIFAKFNRKRRAMIGGWISNMIGEEEKQEYQFLPPTADPQSKQSAAEPSAGRAGGIKEEIEESGVLSGLTNRIKKTADSYLNQKLDEIEQRIDRKLDEIDRRLAEWRDKEIANRLRILKITLWASVIVGAFSLIYSYVKVYFL